MANLKLALRTLLRMPFVTGIAVLSLALGIGANAAIFSLFDQMLLQPLPVAEPERLVNLTNPGPKPGSQSCNQAGGCEAVFSFPMFKDLERGETAFSGLAAHRIFGANLAHRDVTLNGEGILVSGSYFPVLGLRPALGRLLGPADDERIGEHYVAVLSHRFWENQFGADPGVLDQTLVVNGHPLVIVGVAPRGFDGTTLGARPQVFVPITLRGLMNPGFDGFDNRRSYWIYVFGRLKPGVAAEQAQDVVNTVYRPIVQEVEAPLQEGMSEQTMERFRAKEIVLEDGRRGQSSVRGVARTPLILLLSITGFVLLIACANIANLLLARGAGRGAEMAIRGSLGASRRQLLVQLLTESCLLALLGGLASLVVAEWTLGFIASLLPPDATASLELELRPAVVAFAAALSLATGLVFGMYPALHSTRPDLITILKASSGQPSGARAAARFRTSLVTAQIALSMALLVAAGLFIRSLSNITRVDLGVQVENVVTFTVSPQLNGYDTARSRTFFSQLEEELAALPGVTDVSPAVIAILAGDNWGSDVAVEGFESGPDVDANANTNRVGAGYFRTLGIPLLAGRDFAATDDAAAPQVAIVNQAFAKKFGLDEREVVGSFMSEGRDDELDVEIVGLVQDAKYSEVKDQVPPMFFRPYRQDLIGSMTYYLRTGVASAELMRRVPAVVARLDPNLPVEELKTLERQVEENVFLDRMISTLSASFAVLATLLAAVGLYGVLAYTVAQRTREIGLRMALGATSQRVRKMVLGQVTRMLAAGGAIGVAAALLLGRVARSLLFELQPHDPVVVVVVGVMLGLVAFGAGYLPALRASRVDPMKALRYE